jgi:hypothetical protein
MAVITNRKRCERSDRVGPPTLRLGVTAGPKTTQQDEAVTRLGICVSSTQKLPSRVCFPAWRRRLDIAQPQRAVLGSGAFLGD